MDETATSWREEFEDALVDLASALRLRRRWLELEPGQMAGIEVTFDWMLNDMGIVDDDQPWFRAGSFLYPGEVPLVHEFGRLIKAVWDESEGDTDELLRAHPRWPAVRRMAAALLVTMWTNDAQRGVPAPPEGAR